MNKKYLLEIVDYSNWVDNAVISWLEQINDEQWEREIASSFPSIAKTTLHLVSAKKIWLDFWKKEANPTYLSSAFKGSKNELLALWKETMAEYKTFLEQYPESNYNDIISIKIGGEDWQMEFPQTVLHHNNHATYHRGQLVTLLRNVGFTNLTNTDLATFYVKVKNSVAD